MSRNNVGETLDDSGHENDFLDIILNAWSVKKSDKLDFIKI